MATLKHYLLIIVAALSFVLMPVAAGAQYVPLACDGSGGVSQGTLYDESQTGACMYSGLQHIFSVIVCNFVLILNSVMDQVYCGMQYQLAPILAIVMSLYIAVFGVQILMGTAQLNAKEIVMRLLKMSAVWILTTQSTWGINIIFSFFIGGATQGAMWVVNSIASSNSTCGALILPGPSNISNLMPMYSFLDCIIYSAITTPFLQANDKVMGFFIVMMFFFPALFALACRWLLQTAMMLVRALVDGMLDLSAIAFLIALSFIFLSFMLFQSTNHFFEDWLKYLIAYTLRIIIVFAIISLWIATMTIFGGFFDEVSDLVVPLKKIDVDNVFNINDTFGICSYNSFLSPPGLPGVDCVANLPCLPALACDGTGVVLSASDLQFRPDFVYFLAYNLTVLSVIGYAFNVMMKEAPRIAQSLSGPAQVRSLGGGFGMKGFGQAGGGGGKRG